jgi:ABC-type Fe3+-hydroxamate transport system substrate-binding protein
LVVLAGKRVTEEEAAKANPDVIVLAGAAAGDRPDNVPAIRNRKVFVVRDELLDTPGPPLMEGAHELLAIFFQSVRAS